MKEYAQYIGSTDGVHHLTAANGNTKDIMNTVLLADGKAAAYCAKLAQALTGADAVATCYNIWNFWKQNVKYVEDPDGYQFIKSPAYLYETGEGDCKSYSVAVASCLKHLGIPYAYRFITQEADKPFHHVYVVAYTNHGTVLIDCVIDFFNKENAYARKKDVRPTGANTPMPKAAAIGRANRGVHYLPNSIGATTDLIIAPPNTPGYWTNMIADYKLNWHTKHQKLEAMVWNDFKAKWVSKPLRFSMFVDAYRKHKEEFFNLAFAMSYHFWPDTDVPLPADLKAKRDYGFQLMNNLMEFGLREATLLMMCDLSCFKLYGVPFDYLVYRSKNITLYGQPWAPVNGVPYWDMRTQTLKNNNAPTLDMAFQLAACMPYMPTANAPTTVGNNKPAMQAAVEANPPQAIALPDGMPYWCIGGWVMRNGASDQVIKNYLKDNPNRPPINTYNKPTEAQINAAVATYNKWLNGNIAALPIIPGTTVGNGKPAMGKTRNRVGYLPVAEIVSIVVACVTAAATIATVVAKIVEGLKVNKGNINTIPEFKTDFKEVYQSADGCIMYQNVSNGTWRKCCPNGQCQDNANPNDPANQAAAGNWGFGSGGKGWLLVAAAALLLIFGLGSSSKSNS